MRFIYNIFGEGETLLLLHGWGGSSESFLRVQEFLSTNYRVIVLDLPGFGKSEEPKKPWNLDDYVEFLREFLSQMNIEKCSLAGHSFGGRIAIKFCAQYPEKIDKLVLIACAGIKHKKSLEEKATNFFANVGKKIFSLPILKNAYNPGRWVLYKLLLRRQDYYQANPLMRETMKLVINEDLKPLLSKIAAPTLIIWGENDEITPLEDARIMHREIQRSRLEIIKGAGHYLPRRNPEEIARLMKNFLR